MLQIKNLFIMTFIGFVYFIYYVYSRRLAYQDIRLWYLRPTISIY